MQTGADVDSGSGALTRREAERLLTYYQALAGSGAPDRMIEAFTSDVIVRFADFPEMRGQAELKRLLVARGERQEELSPEETATRHLWRCHCMRLGWHLGGWA